MQAASQLSEHSRLRQLCGIVRAAVDHIIDEGFLLKSAHPVEGRAEAAFRGLASRTLMKVAHLANARSGG